VNVRRILAPVDFSECSHHALSYAIGLGARLGARVDALHVLSPPPYVPMDLMLWGPIGEPHTKAVQEALRKVVAEASAGRSVDVAARVETGVVPDVVLDAAEAADLIVMGTHGRSGVARIVLGSVAERVVRFASRPVLTVPLGPATAE
jgi:nucleotide-binding universal stress UspA family protein